MKQYSVLDAAVLKSLTEFSNKLIKPTKAKFLIIRKMVYH